MESPINIFLKINVIHINSLKRKKRMITSIDTQKAFDKNLIPIHHKNSHQIRNKKELPQSTTKTFIILMKGETVTSGT